MAGKATPVEQIDPAKKSSEILGPSSDEVTVSMEMMDKKCYWNDAVFENGDQVTLGDECYECSFGSWIKISD